MVFSSTIFLFAFLPLTLIGYYLIRPSLRNVFLLVMSLLFYAYGEPRFVFVMMASILANYLLGLLIGRFGQTRGRRPLLCLALLCNLGLLFYYKYYDFAITNLNGLFRTSLPLRHIALPIGISFFTFQGMSYVLDVYMGKAPVQKNPLHVALYIALFPQLIAGPIVRYADVNEQIVHRQETLVDFAAGVQRFTVGLAKKIILSNTFALLADEAFGKSPFMLEAGLAWLGAAAYAMQIYFDFSGYSDMAIGLGRMFGFRFLENFNYPYTSTSVSAFWRKWHISLSSWFRDYVYIPLGGNRRGNVYLHLFIVFFLTGLWHGASWNFVAWGFWHGAFMILERLCRNRRMPVRVPSPLKWLYAMLVVLLGWVLFRATSFKAALAYFMCMFGRNGFDASAFILSLHSYGATFLIGLIAMLPVVPWLKRLRARFALLDRVGHVLEPVICGGLLLLGIAYTVTTTYNPFIYFNF